MIETAVLPVVDVHCHPFLHQGKISPEVFTNTVSFGGASTEYMVAGGIKSDDRLKAELQRFKRDTLYFRYMQRELAAYFNCPVDLDAIIQERNRTIAQGYSAYVRSLYADCGLTTLVVDFGYPQPPVPVSRFSEEVPLELVPIFRIEPLIVDLLGADLGWEEFRVKYDETIAEALQNGGYRGLKSIIAYRTGLEISPLSRGQDHGRQALDAIKRGTGGGATKKLRDHLLCRALELCMEHDVPMQIHTGMGDHEVNLVQCRPALLMDLLRYPAFRSCRVLLVHSGYPYHAEAGYMAHVLPRVYCDISEGIPFAGNAARRIVTETLEMAPLSKVLYGSDGYGAPEINYVGAKLAKRAVGQALGDLVDDGLLSEVEAQQAAGFILAENARRLYKLDQ